MHTDKFVQKNNVPLSANAAASTVALAAFQFRAKQMAAS